MKTPIALLLNDLHITKDNIPEFEKNWNEALDVCAKNGVEEMFIGGDVFTERSSQSLSVLMAVRKAYNLASKAGLTVTVAEGNHDKVDQEKYEGYNHLWKPIGNRVISGLIVVSDYDVVMLGSDWALLIMSYFPENGSFLKHLETAVNDVIADETLPEIKSKSQIIIYCHEGIHGALGDFEIDGELPQEPFIGFKAVLVGHYHNRVRIKGTNIEYIGSSRQHNFGEDEEKGYTLLYDDGTYEFVKNKVNTRYRTIELTADQIGDYELEQDPLYKTKVKVKCDDKQAQLIDKQKLLDLGFSKVELVTQSVESAQSGQSAITEKYDKAGIKKEYQRYCDENDISSELGMKYLG